MKVLTRFLSFLILLALSVPMARASEGERTFTVINAANGLADNSAQVIKCTKTGRLIISTIGNINFYDGKSFSHADVSGSNEYQLPNYHGHYHLYFDREHHLWVKDKQKVYCLDLLTERYVDSPDSVIQTFGPPSQVIDLFTDSESQMWLLLEEGLYSPHYKRIFPVLKDQYLQDVDFLGGRVYTFYDNGLVIGYDSLGHEVCKVPAYDQQKAMRYADSSVLEPFGEGFFQIRNGANGAILQFFDARQLRWEAVMEQDYHLNNMTFDGTGKKLYVPSEYGYWTYQTDTKELVHVPGLQLADGKMMMTDCNTLAFDHQGGMWIGTENRGVLYARPNPLPFHAYFWDTEEARHYTMMMESLGKNISYYENIRANFQYNDSRGWHWIGTRQGLFIEREGLSRLRYTKREGLNNEVVHSIIEDADKNVWVSTSYGITFFLIKDGKIVFVNNFTNEDGVPNESFESGKALLLDDGHIVMKGVDHVVLFHPDDLRDVNEPHLITNIKPKLIRMFVNGNNVEPGTPNSKDMVTDRAFSRAKHINLRSDQNSITLHFSALNYSRPLQTYYRVRVYELGNKWEVFSHFTSGNVDDRGMLHYPMANLEPGDYHVEVQASIFPDKWEEDIPEEDRFVWEVHVKQPWWRTTGLYVLLAAVLLLLLLVNFYLYNRNTRMRDRRNNEEGDVIRKIRYFVERVNSLSAQPLSPSQANLPGIPSSQAGTMSPAFIDIMQKIIPYVESHQRHGLTMHELSKVCGVETVKLYEIVSSNLYKSPRELSLIMRLHKAADLLQSTDLSIEQISVDCGFYTPNFFYGNFFHEYKQTPGEYRQSRAS